MRYLLQIEEGIDQNRYRSFDKPPNNIYSSFFNIIIHEGAKFAINFYDSTKVYAVV